MLLLLLLLLEVRVATAADSSCCCCCCFRDIGSRLFLLRLRRCSAHAAAAVATAWTVPVPLFVDGGGWIRHMENDEHSSNRRIISSAEQRNENSETLIFADKQSLLGTMTKEAKQ